MSGIAVASGPLPYGHPVRPASLRHPLRLAAAPVVVLLLAAMVSGPVAAEPPHAPLGVVLKDRVVFPVIRDHPVAPVVTTPCTTEIVLEGGTRILHLDVVLDPGHGGPETGSVGSNGLVERDLNLSVALLAERELVDLGYSVLLTRRTDLHMSIRQRAAIARAVTPRVFLSIHHNGGAVRPSGDAGTEAFHQAGNADSRRLAGILYEELQAAFAGYWVPWVDTVHQGASSRLRASGADAYGVLRLAPEVTSVITEALYLSNPPEAELIADPTVQAVEGRALATGIDRFLTTDDPGSGFRPAFVDEAMTGTGTGWGCVDPDYSGPSDVSAGYTADEHSAILAAATRLGRSPDWLQRFGVHAMDFFHDLSGRPDLGPLPESRVPDVTGPVVLMSSWTTEERAVLRRVAAAYGITDAEAQKLGAILMVFLAELMG